MQESCLQKDAIWFEMVTIYRPCKKKMQLYEKLSSQSYNQDEALTCWNIC